MAARKYAFGSTNSGSRNLSALINSLQTQMQDTQDQEEFDAFNNGGVGPDGKPVTAQSLKDYMAKRINDYAVGDPNRIKWENKQTQTLFSMGEQDIGAQYKAGKISASAVAAWYRTQLKNATPGTGFYDTIMNQISSFAKAGAASGRASAAKAITDKLNAENAGPIAIVNNGSAMDDAVTEAARRAGLIQGTQGLGSAEGGDLIKLIDQGGVTYKDANGKSHVVTMATWNASTVASTSAYTVIRRNYVAAGRSVVTIDKDILANRTRTATITGEDLQQKADAFKAIHDDAIAKANGNATAEKAANDAYAAGLRGLASSPEGAASDSATVGALNATADAASGQGDGKSTDWSGTSNAQLTTDAANSTAGDTALKNKSAIYGQAKEGGPLTTHPVDPHAAAIPGAVLAITQGPDGAPVPTQLIGTPVYGTTYVMNGHAIEPGQITPADLAAGIANGTIKPTQGAAVGYSYGVAGANGAPPAISAWSVLDPTGLPSYFTGKTSPFDDHGLTGASGVWVGASGTANVVNDPSGKPLVGDPLLVSNAFTPQQVSALNSQPTDPTTGLNPLGLTADESKVYSAYAHTNGTDSSEMTTLPTAQIFSQAQQASNMANAAAAAPPPASTEVPGFRGGRFAASPAAPAAPTPQIEQSTSLPGGSSATPGTGVSFAGRAGIIQPPKPDAPASYTGATPPHFRLGPIPDNFTVPNVTPASPTPAAPAPDAPTPTPTLNPLEAPASPKAPTLGGAFNPDPSNDVPRPRAF